MKYRVLVVDDSVVMRGIVRHCLESDPEIEVVGVAANGNIALAMVEQYAVDTITLDLEMPEMNGLQTLRALRARGIHIPVILFSTLTEHGALATLDALAAGADDYVAKPTNAGNMQESLSRISLEVIPKIKALCWKARNSASPLAPAAASPLAGAAETRIEAVAIGTSTGGPNALAEVLGHIPADFPVPILIVQHMPPTFTRFLAERLTASSSLLVREATPAARIEAGQAWIAPGDFHMNLRREDSAIRLAVFRALPENSCRPSVDVLFRSVAEVYGRTALAVVMTGMGQDGLRGCEHIKEAGGQILVQDEATSVVWGMPGFVARAGLADSVLPLGDIAHEILRRVCRGRGALPGASLAGGAPQPVRHPAQGGHHGV
jgi:two-component system, chemotaxis family, protein-glutamate methylesterase/glutaminase